MSLILKNNGSSQSYSRNCIKSNFNPNAWLWDFFNANRKYNFSFADYKNVICIRWYHCPISKRVEKSPIRLYFLFQKWNKKKWTLSNARRDGVGLNEFVCGCSQVIRERIFCFHVGFLALDEHVNLDIFLGRQNFQKKRSALYKIWEKGCHLGHYQYIHAQSVYNRPCEKWLFMGEILRSG